MGATRTLEREYFDRYGWVIVDVGWSKKDIDILSRDVDKMIHTAKKESWRPCRYYYDHARTNNMAAIELPFNVGIASDRFRSSIRAAYLDKVASTLMGWEVAECTLARIFTMESFAYRGRWHRDAERRRDGIVGERRIGCALFFKNQAGFRLLRKRLDIGGDQEIIDGELDELIIKSGQVLRAPRGSYDIVEVNAGQALFFDASLLHQGSSRHKRSDLHMIFQEGKSTDKPNEGLGMRLHEALCPNLMPDQDCIEIKDYYKGNKDLFSGRQRVADRLLNSADYYIPIGKYLRWRRSLGKRRDLRRLEERGWYVEWDANSILQRGTQ